MKMSDRRREDRREGEPHLGGIEGDGQPHGDRRHDREQGDLYHQGPGAASGESPTTTESRFQGLIRHLIPPSRPRLRAY